MQEQEEEGELNKIEDKTRRKNIYTFFGKFKLCGACAFSNLFKCCWNAVIFIHVKCALNLGEC